MRTTLPAPDAVDDSGPLGSAGPALLSPQVSQTVIEVDRSPGAELAIDPRSVVARELVEHGGKETIRAGGDSTVPARTVYTVEDLRAIAAGSRATTSRPGRPAVYILVLDGRFAQEGVTGVAFAATSFALFPNQIGGGVVGLDRSAFETAVVVHELGHLFGLVNLTGEGSFHEDPEHQGHSASRGSVMYWAIESSAIVSLFGDGPPTDFDAADRKEMGRIRNT